MNKKYVLEKLAAMTTQMAESAIDKVTKALEYNKGYLRRGSQVFPEAEAAAKAGDEGAKLFIRQGGLSNDPMLARERMRKHLNTLDNLNTNRNSNGDYLEINDARYNELKSTIPVEERFPVLRGQDRYVWEEAVARGDEELTREALIGGSLKWGETKKAIIRDLARNKYLAENY